MEEWKEYKLEDIGKITTGKTPKTAIKEYFDGNILFVTPADINTPYKYVSKTARYLSEKGLNSISSNSIEKGSICVSCIGNIGYVGIVNMKCASNQQINSITVNKEHDRGFVYYAIKNLWPFFKNYEGQSTTLSILNKGQFSKIVIKAPQKDIQQRIASILSSLDDKIELNRKINANLEAQAQALFKSWFVDFEPFKDQPFVESELGMIPEGWRVGEIGDYCNIRSGFAFKSSWWSDNGIKVIKIKNITEDGRIDISDCSFVSKEHAMLAKGFQTKVGDLLIAMTGATIGKFCIIPTDTPMCINQRVGKFFLGDKPLEKLPFIYYNLKRPNIFEEIFRKGQGSAQPNISGKDIESIKLVFPPDSIISRFNQSAIIYIKMGILNEQESRRLASLRDTLLPRLMSGELKVNEVI